MNTQIVIVCHEDLNFIYGSLLKLQSWRATAWWKIPTKSNFKCNQMHRKTACPFVYSPFKSGFAITAICRMTGNYLRTSFRSKDGHNIQLRLENERQLKPVQIHSKAFPMRKATFTRIPTNLQQRWNHPWQLGWDFTLLLVILHS